MTVSGSLAVMRKAFSTASAAAKIPDGVVSASIGERAATANSILSPNGRITLVLSSSLTNFLQYGTTVPPSASDIVTLTNVANDNHSSDYQLGNSGNIDQWRLVSAGIRLTCINGSDTLNGWFEAIRVTSSYTIAELSSGVLANAFENNIVSSPNWANHPSFVTGRLRDLGKHTFYLQPTDKSEFVKTGTAIDNKFDIILIRIHSLPSDEAAQQTGVHYHVVKNFEICYDAQSTLSRFQTSCPTYLKGVDNVRRAMTKDPKASMIRAASAYAYR